jgi:hypothetical protein
MKMPKAAVAISIPEERIIENPNASSQEEKRSPTIVIPEQVLPEETQQEQSAPAL